LAIQIDSIRLLVHNLDYFNIKLANLSGFSIKYSKIPLTAKALSVLKGLFLFIDKKILVYFFF